MDEFFKPKFPQLSNVAGKKTSNPTPAYNCIAWAFKDDTRHWWPNPTYSYWPFDPGQMTLMEAFEKLFESDGWESTDDQQFEAGYEKIALYAKDGSPTHAARLLPSGEWTSKLGQSIDLSHSFTDLDGPEYGAVVKIYRKPCS